METGPRAAPAAPVPAATLVMRRRFGLSSRGRGPNGEAGEREAWTRDLGPRGRARPARLRRRRRRDRAAAAPAPSPAPDRDRRPARGGRPLRHARGRRRHPPRPRGRRRRRSRRRRRASSTATSPPTRGSPASTPPGPRWRCSRATRPRPRSTTSPPPRLAGLPDLAAVAADPLFAPLAADPDLGPRLAALAATPPAPPPAPVPAPVQGGVAPVAAANTAWNPATERLEAAFALPQASPAPRSCPPGRRPRRLDLLREHWKRGRAAGNAGDLYDNRDRGHSALKPAAFPQLAHRRLCPRGAGAELDYGLQRQAPLRPPDLRQLLDRGHRRASSGAACRASR